MAGKDQTGYTGMVNMQGMKIPVLNGFANYKGKEFNVSHDGSVIMDDKNSIVGHIQDGEVIPPDPTRVSNFMNGKGSQPTSTTAPMQSPIMDALAKVGAVRDTAQGDISKLLAPGNTGTTMDNISSLMNGVGDLKSGISSAKNELKAGMAKSLLKMIL